MTTVYLSRTVTYPDGEDIVLELAVELSGDGEIIAIGQVDIVA